MKRIFSLFTLLFALFVQGAAAQSLKGAWQLKGTPGTVKAVLIISDSYFMQTTYDEGAKTFVSALGGTYEAGNGEIEVKLEFHSENKDAVGQTSTIPYAFDKNELGITVDGDTQLWERLDDGSGQLSAAWRISAREQDGKMNPMNPGPRKTIKILSGTRFQWAAINTETGEFSGTGGGTYTLDNGKYTEKIIFFSRDSTRVGASLTFNAKITGNDWMHSGLSSKGDKIAEVWSKVK